MIQISLERKREPHSKSGSRHKKKSSSLLPSNGKRWLKCWRTWLMGKESSCNGRKRTMQIKSLKYRAYPNQATTEKLQWILSRCCELYNAALAERRDAYRMAGRSISYYEQKRDLVEIKTCTIKREGEHWYVIFTCEVETESLPPSDEEVGIDLGITHFAALSDGACIESPRYYRRAEKKLKRLQRDS